MPVERHKISFILKIYHRDQAKAGVSGLPCGIFIYADPYERQLGTKFTIDIILTVRRAFRLVYCLRRGREFVHSFDSPSLPLRKQKVKNEKYSK